MHQHLQFPSHKPIIDEEVFFDLKARIVPLQIAGVIISNPVPQDQVLRSRGRPDGISLHKADAVQRSLQSRRFRQAADHGKASQVFDGDRQTLILSKQRTREARLKSLSFCKGSRLALGQGMLCPDNSSLSVC
jgi:hypothetical protein